MGSGELTLGKVRAKAHGQVKKLSHHCNPGETSAVLDEGVEVELDGKKCQDSGNALNVDPEGFANMLDNEWDGKREATDDKVWA